MGQDTKPAQQSPRPVHGTPYLECVNAEQEQCPQLVGSSHSVRGITLSHAMEHACAGRSTLAHAMHAAQEQQHASHTENRQLDTLGPGTSFRRIPNIVSALHVEICAAQHSLGVRPGFVMGARARGSAESRTSSSRGLVTSQLHQLLSRLLIYSTR